MILQPGVLPSHSSHDRIEATKIWFKYINHKEECFKLMTISMLLNFIDLALGDEDSTSLIHHPYSIATLSIRFLELKTSLKAMINSYLHFYMLSEFGKTYM